MSTSPLSSIRCLPAVALSLGPLSALAQTIPGSPENTGPSQWAGLVLKAVQDKNWAMLVAVALTGLVWAVRRYGGNTLPWLKTDRGGALLVLLLGIGGGIINALAAGAPLTPQLLLDGARVGLISAGGYAVVRKLLFGEKPEPVPQPVPQVKPAI